MSDRVSVRRAARMLHTDEAKIRNLIYAGQVQAWKTAEGKRGGKPYIAFEVYPDEVRRVLDRITRFVPPALKGKPRRAPAQPSHPGQLHPHVTC